MAKATSKKSQQGSLASVSGTVVLVGAGKMGGALLEGWLARKLNRPVRWTSDRSEAFLTDFQGRDLKADVSAAFDKRGRILGLHVRQIANLGAYPASFAPLANGVRIVTCAYAVPANSTAPGRAACRSFTLPTLCGTWIF